MDKNTQDKNVKRLLFALIPLIVLMYIVSNNIINVY